MTERNACKNPGKTWFSSAAGTAFEHVNPAREVDLGEYLEGLSPQDYGAYSEDAHAVWREVLAHSERVVSRHADHIHPAYVDGLRALQLPSRVPRTDELNERLLATGWKTVAVDGYLPATVYAALMTENIFPVSSRIRRREHIDFAPEPDMVHDILGHLPMLFCAEHRDYLRELAALACRAIPNDLDTAYHEAVRRTAELKSTPTSEPTDLVSAEASLEQVYSELVSNASEVTCLRRLYIWSIEFGIFGTCEDFMVHGAALMSAPTELSRVLSGAARLEPYSALAIQHENSFSDLLERYFVASDYTHLHEVLSSYARTMQQSIIPATSDVRELRPRAFDQVRRSNA
jgi:phenylalanine-4-hydroxylase